MTDKPKKEAITAESALALLDKAITMLSFMVDFIPGKVDDLVLDFLKWARGNPILMEWLEKSPPTPENAIITMPEEVTEALRQYQVETGVQTEKAVDIGTWMEMAKMVMVIFENIRKRRAAKSQPAQ